MQKHRHVSCTMLAVLLWSLALLPPPAQAAITENATSIYLVDDTTTISCESDTVVICDRRILIQIDNIDDDSIVALLPDGCTLVSGYQPSGHAVVRVDDTLSYCDFLDSLRARTGIMSADPN